MKIISKRRTRVFLYEYQVYDAFDHYSGVDSNGYYLESLWFVTSQKGYKQPVATIVSYEKKWNLLERLFRLNGYKRTK